VLKEKGYSLDGYSPDLYYYLSENNIGDSEECEAYFAYLESVYG
jgi:hypothetical protein